jgi:uncharacterized membrane protein (GlpM family)
MPSQIVAMISTLSARRDNPLTGIVSIQGFVAIIAQEIFNNF